mmetsp:Transcript_144759/g.376689  ORF Transcript_144759/g.376689 Transcript_144759/m.376689 type:complete len:258 (+) Transcript_144759:751-1524(+)
MTSRSWACWTREICPRSTAGHLRILHGLQHLHSQTAASACVRVWAARLHSWTPTVTWPGRPRTGTVRIARAPDASPTTSTLRASLAPCSMTGRCTALLLGDASSTTRWTQMRQKRSWTSRRGSIEGSGASARGLPEVAPCIRTARVSQASARTPPMSPATSTGASRSARCGAARHGRAGLGMNLAAVVQSWRFRPRPEIRHHPRRSPRRRPTATSSRATLRTRRSCQPIGARASSATSPGCHRRPSRAHDPYRRAGT